MKIIYFSKRKRFFSKYKLMSQIFYFKLKTAEKGKESFARIL